VANAVHNDGMDAEDLFVSACYADEGGTLKRWRPRARGRATRIRKRQCHITVIVSRLPDERLARRRAEREAQGAQRSRRVAESRRRADLSGRLSRRRAAQEAAEAEAAAQAEAEAADAAAAAEAEALEAAAEAETTEATAPEAEAAESNADTEGEAEASEAPEAEADSGDGDGGEEEKGE
jgi:large subunit ribosomal protein L22